jgi:hypothetical protein
VQVGEEILDLLLRENITEATHFASAESDDFAHALIIRR